MIDLDQPGLVLVAFCFLVLALLVATRWSPLRRLLGAQLQRAGAWLWTKLVPEPSVDALTEELYRIHRMQKLHADIARLQRILATDAAMSATRQLGNRLAYAWLINERARVRQLPQNQFDDLVFDGWDATPSAVAAVRFTPTRTADVEVLDVGWRT